MYHYIYHQDLHEQRHQKNVLNLESKLNTLGLRGKITRLGSYSTPEESLKNNISEHVETLVVVGDDELFSRTLSFVERSDHKPTVGYIPFFNSTSLSQALGISHGEDAVMTLARRRTETIHLAHINQDVFFVGSVVIETSNPTITINNIYTVSLGTQVRTLITNLPNPSVLPSINRHITPQDTRVEVIISHGKKKGFFIPNHTALGGFLSGRNILVQTEEPAPVLIDGFYQTKTPITVGVSTQKITLVVGKDRLF